MEGLTKQQLILVALLVSFVTSIATGIVTVALMDQAPPGVTETINQVVERTIEKVVPSPTSQTASVVTKETVVVKESDMVVSAIDKNSPSLVRVSYQSQASGKNTVAALGVILSRSGIVATDYSFYVPGVSYSVALSDGRVYPAQQVFADSNWNFALFKIKVTDGEKANFTAANLADSNGLKLGQTVIYLGGTDQNEVESGLISSLISADSPASSATSTDSTPKNYIAIVPNIKSSPDVPGEVLLDLSGDVAAMRMWRTDHYSYIASNLIGAAYAAFNGVVSSTTASQTQ